MERKKSIRQKTALCPTVFYSFIWNRKIKMFSCQIRYFGNNRTANPRYFTRNRLRSKKWVWRICQKIKLNGNMIQIDSKVYNLTNEEVKEVNYSSVQNATNIVIVQKKDLENIKNSCIRFNTWAFEYFVYFSIIK